MKGLKLQRLKFILGMVILVILVLFMVYWESAGREKFTYVEVLAASTDISKGAVLNDSMLKIIKVEANKLISKPVYDKNTILKLAAKQYIPQNEQLSREFFDNPDIVLKDNQKIFKVPSDWIIAVPSSIRRKDRVYFYETYNSLGNENENLNNKPSTPPSANQGGENIKTGVSKAIENEIKSNSKSIMSAVVAYVKDSANREVINVGSNERFDGSSQVASIEIIVTDDQVDILKEAFDNGYKFLVLYN